MADIEQEFLCAVCRSNKVDSVDLALTRVDPVMFSGFAVEAEYVWNYKEKYNRFPTTRTLRKRFPAFVVTKTQEPISYYCDQLIERETFKGMQKIMSNVNKLIRSKNLGGVDEAVQEMLKAQELLRGGYSSDVSWQDFDPLQNYMERQSFSGTFTTPYDALNRMVHSLRPKQLVSLVGRPGMCKTWILLLFAYHFWMQGAVVLIISKEMGREEIYERLDALAFGMDWIKFLEGRLSIRAIKQLRAKRNKAFKEHPNKFIVHDSEDLDASGLSAVDAKIVEHKPDVMIIDGSYLLDESTGNSAVEKAYNISRALKRLVKHRNVLGVQTLQFGRKQEEDKETTLAHIGGADAYGQDSDYVFFIKGKKGDPTRTIELGKGRTLASGGEGEFYINALFDPKIDFSEMKQGSPAMVSLSTVEG